MSLKNKTYNSINIELYINKNSKIDFKRMT